MAELTDYLKQVLADKADKSRAPAKKTVNRPVHTRPRNQDVWTSNIPKMEFSKPNIPEPDSQYKRQTDSAPRTGSQRIGMPDGRTAAEGQAAAGSGITAENKQTESSAAPAIQAAAVNQDGESGATGLIGYLQRAVADKASDLFIVAGGKISEKVDKVMLPISRENVTPAEAERLITEFYTRAKRSMDGYLECGDDDFSLSIPGLARFRINTYRQRGSMAAVVRVVIFDIPDWRSLHIPAQVIGLSAATHGMVLVTGTAGSGKSTTQACIIDQINKTRGCHIITLEDPIEYLHRDRKSIVSQREIAIDSVNYLTALRACLRQAPDVISLGEMRDHETIRTAMTAAETGHLLITTLHTQGAVNTIDRIIDSFPSSQQAQVRVQLSMVLHTVVSQQLLPGVNGELVPAYEIMCMNNAIRSLIRESKSHQIDNVIAAGSAEGMVTMDQSILRLYYEGNITKDTALEYAEHPDQLLRRLGTVKN